MANTNTNTHAFTINSEHAPKLRDWFNTGRGVKVWINQEIASGASREVFTPGDHEAAPNWRYSNPQTLTRDDLVIEQFEVIESFRGRFKAMYWGPWVAQSTEDKAKRLCAKHAVPDTSWRWEHDSLAGYVKVEIGKTYTQSFIDWEQNNG